jgi:hypothetical protein
MQFHKRAEARPRLDAGIEGGKDLRRQKRAQLLAVALDERR